MFLKVDVDILLDIFFILFFILFVRYKGDLVEFVEGVKKIKELKLGDKVLIVEVCIYYR